MWWCILGKQNGAMTEAQAAHLERREMLEVASNLRRNLLRHNIKVTIHFNNTIMLVMSDNLTDIYIYIYIY